MFTVYILKTSKNTLYIGQTNNIEIRLEKHRSGKGAKYLRFSESFELVYTENLSSRSAALKREAALRKLTRPQKDALISGTGL